MLTHAELVDLEVQAKKRKRYHKKRRSYNNQVHFAYMTWYHRETPVQRVSRLCMDQRVMRHSMGIYIDQSNAIPTKTHCTNTNRAKHHVIP